MKYYLLSALLAYLIGSINPSVLLGKYIFKRDLRLYGSKNPGTSNTVYVYGAKAGITVLLLDVLKGFISVWLAKYLFSAYVTDLQFLLIFTSFFAIFGHCKSIFLKFSGGKGLATTAGVYLYQFPLIVGILVVIFVIVVLLSKYISIGTFTTILIFPFIQIYLNAKNALFTIESILIMFIISFYVIYRHRENIVKLRHGTEMSIRTPRITKEQLNT